MKDHAWGDRVNMQGNMGEQKQSELAGMQNFSFNLESQHEYIMYRCNTCEEKRRRKKIACTKYARLQTAIFK